MAVTGRCPPEEREERGLAALAHAAARAGRDRLPLRGHQPAGPFDAVVHYDLSWNPTRHEQREGRVDRYGQAATGGAHVLLYGEDNAIDGVVLDVLLRKAETIRKSLGVSVPVPADTNKVLEAIFEGLFLRGGSDPRQLALQFEGADLRLQELDRAWTSAADREKQLPHHLRPARHETGGGAPGAGRGARGALAKHGDVARFVRDAVGRLGAPLGKDDRDRTTIAPANLPLPVREAAGFDVPSQSG